MSTLPSTAREWRRRANRIARRDLIDVVLVAVVFGLIAIMTERHRRVTNSARVSCPAEVSSPAASTVDGETWTGAGVTPAGGGHLAHRLAEEATPENRRADVAYLNAAYAMACAGGHVEPTGDGPKTIQIAHPGDDDPDTGCWGENSWQRLSGAALIEALDWVISEGNGVAESTVRHAHWCRRAWQVADAARAHLSFDSQDGMMQADLAAILRAVGLSDAARPYSPHEVIERDLLPRIAAILAGE